MANCPPSSPCSCVGTVSTTSVPCPTPGNCLTLCDIVILSKDGVGPCGQAGTINVADTDIYKHDFTACGTDTVNWILIDFDGPVAAATITTAGQLTWITGDGSTAGKYSTITLKACCGILSAYMCVIIGVKDLCNCPTCNDCNNCDPCDGQCLDVQVDIAVTSSETINC